MIRILGAVALLLSVPSSEWLGATQAPPPSAQAPAAQGGQKPATPQPGPTFRTGVNFVRVDVIASDKDGKPIPDLKQTDFEVTEDGKPQAIETFRFIEVTGNPAPGDPEPKEIRSDYDEESEAARDDVRLFALFLDDYHVRRGASMVVKPALTSFIQKQLSATDMVGVMFPLTPVSALLMTRSRDKLMEAVQHFEGRKFDYIPRNEFEEQYAMYPATIVEQVRNQVTLSALRSLVVHMGALREGRKAVILVSEGFSNILPPQLNDPIAGMPGIGNPNRGNPMADVDDRTSFFANLDIQQELREVYDAANRSNTTIYTLDPRGLAGSEFDINENVGQQTDRRFLQSTMDTLRVLAENTDGRAIVNRNDLEGGLKQVVKDSSAYYLLGYNSTRTAADGKYHEIKVRIRRPGVQVRARKGYWALTKEELAKSLAPPPPPIPSAVSKALGSMSESRRGRYIRTWLGTTRGENGKTRVTFVWEPLPSVPGVERTATTGLTLIASGVEGPYFRGDVPDSPRDGSPEAAPPPANDGAAGKPPTAEGKGTLPAVRGPARATFDADPGPLQIRYAVHGPKGETVDTDVREFKVPDLTTPQIALSTPSVLRAGNALEYRALVANPDSVPTAGREFRRTERLLIRFDAFAPGNETPVVTARVLNRVGNGMADLLVKAPEAAGKPYQVDLPLAGFAAGEYLVEVKAKGVEGEAKELVPLRITS
ncbi:MAG TPA: VWA domain-containing protein [Vicinamibacterales bacterium]